MTFLVLHLFFTTAFLGLIWVIQLVHYPFFEYIYRKKSHLAYEFHQFRMGVIVIPLMIGEVSTGCLLAVVTWSQFSMINAINITLMVLIWLQTFVTMVPLHGQLLNHANDRLIQRLVWCNWFRTILWTIRSFLCIYFLLSLLNA